MKKVFHLQYLVLQYLDHNKKQLKILIKHKNLFSTQSDQIIIINNTSWTRFCFN